MRNGDRLAKGICAKVGTRRRARQERRILLLDWMVCLYSCLLHAVELRRWGVLSESALRLSS